jgi:hypothetical protein
MPIPIFWRLILSHIGILLLSGAACFYSIVQLGALSGTARSALDTSQRMIAYQESLTEAFLSEVRYGGKYLISHTEARHDQLLQFKRDFINYLEVLKRLWRSETTSLSEIERLHLQYHELFDREVAYVRGNQNYAQSRYQQERNKIVESTLSEIDLLKVQLRTRLKNELESIEQGARTARKIAVTTTLIVLILGSVISLMVSRSMDDAVTRSAPLIGDPRSDTQSIVRSSFAERVQRLILRRACHLTAFTETLIAVRSRRSVNSKKVH